MTATGAPGAAAINPATQPLKGLRVIEFSHMVMGPTCGMILADLGAEVIKVEPVTGENTRRLLGAGAGFFPMFNRNKKSIGINLRDTEGLAVARKLCLSADMIVENFKSGVMKKYRLDYASLSPENPTLIYVTNKGFLPGPYDNRPALDEVVQMMGGLAYMTGRPGDPLRAGSSVNDIMGGMFGAIGALGALIQRGINGKGMEVQSALYENNVFLMGQHMLQYAVTGQQPKPMPARDNPWAVYDVFTVKDNEQIFLAAVSDKQWQVFCKTLALDDLYEREDLKTNNQRVEVRPWLIETLRERLATHSVSALATLMESAELPFALIRRPEELLDDEHLLKTGGLADVVVPDGEKAGSTVKATLFPFTLDGTRLGVRLQPPRIGQHTQELLEGLGLTLSEIEALREQQSVI
ncbi:MAG: CaiB/BaiF CoA transferase family protein [Burkholderiaceae bacterium]